MCVFGDFHLFLGKFLGTAVFRGKMFGFWEIPILSEAFLGDFSSFLGIFLRFWECFWDKYFGGTMTMRKKNFKGRCEKRAVGKCAEVCKTYDTLQFAYADALQANDGIKEFRCNVPFESEELREYMTDFLCVKTSGDLMVRECVFRKMITKPLTAKLLEASKTYWEKRGVCDWGLVVDEKA